MIPELPPDRAAYPARPVFIRIGSSSRSTSTPDGLIRDLIKDRIRMSLLFVSIGVAAAYVLTASPQIWFGRMILLTVVFVIGVCYAIQFFERWPLEMAMYLTLPSTIGFLSSIVIDPGGDEISPLINTLLTLAVFAGLHFMICWCAGDYSPYQRTPIDRDVPSDMN